MPIYSIQGPDGKTYSIEGPAGATREEIIAQIQARLGQQMQPQEQPESGFMPALRSGIKSLAGETALTAGKLGIVDTAAAEAYQKQKEAEAKQIYAPTQKGWTEAPLTKFGELAGGSLPYMAAPVIAGGAALLLPEATAAAPILGGLTTAGSALGTGLAGLTSGTQFTGSNLARQLDTGKTLEQASLGQAALAAVPQAALDTVSLHMIPGVRQILGAAGKPVTEEMAKKIAEQGIARTLASYGGAAVKTAGAEGLTEAAQQVFERLQAGLNITDAEARNEYFDNFIGGAVLGGALSAPGHYVERGQQVAKGEELRLNREAAARQQAAQQAADLKAQQANDPEYLLDLNQRYEDSLAQMKQLQEAAKKPGKGADETALQDYQDALAAMKTYRSETHSPLVREWRENRDAINNLLAPQRAEAARAQAAQEQMSELKPQETGALFGDLKDQRARDAAAAAETQRQNTEAMQAQSQAQRDALSKQQDYLQQRIDDVSAQYAEEQKIDSPDVTLLRNLANQRGQLEGQLNDVNNQLLAAGPEAAAPKSEAQLLKEAQKAYNKRDYDKHDQLMSQVEEARQRGQAPAAPTQGDLFADADQREAEARQELPSPAEMAAQRKTGQQDYQDFLAGLTEEDPAAAEARQQYETELRMREEGDKATEGKVEDVVNLLGGKEAPDRYPRRNYAGIPDSDAVFSVEDELSKSAFPQGREPQAPYEKEMARLYQVQFQAFHQLRLVIDAVRSGQFLGSGVKSATPARVTKKMLIERAEQAFGDFSRAAADEVNAFRDGTGLPALSAEDQIKLLDAVQKDLREMVVRLQRDESETDWHLIPAQMRSGKIVKPAQFVKVPVSALEQKFGAPLHAPAVIMQSIEETKQQYAEQGRVEQKPGRPTGPIERKEGEFRLFPQDQKAVGDIAEKEYQANPAKQLQKRFDARVNRMVPRDKNILSNALEVLGTPAAPTNLSDTIRDLLDQLENATGIGPREEKALADAVRLAQEAKQQDALLPGGKKPAAQRALFGEQDLEPIATERATAANFEKLRQQRATAYTELADLERTQKTAPTPDITKQIAQQREKIAELETSLKNAVVETDAFRNDPFIKSFTRQLEQAKDKLARLEESRAVTKALTSAKQKAEADVKTAEDGLAQARKEAIERAMSGEGIPGIRYVRDERAVALQDALDDLRADLAEGLGLTPKERSKLKAEIKSKERQLEEASRGLSETKLRAEPVLTQAEKTERRAEVFAEERRTKPDTTGAGTLSTEKAKLRTSLGPAVKPISGGQVTQKRVVEERGRSTVSKEFLKQSGKIAEGMQPQIEARQAAIAALVKRKKLVFDEATKEAFDSPEVRKIEREAGMGSPRHLDAVALKADEIARNKETPVLRVSAQGLNDKFDVAAGQKLVDALKAKLNGDLKITYVPDFNNMPLRLRKHFAMEGMKAAKGGLFKAGKELVIFGNTHSDIKDFETTLLHEALGHYGVVKLLGIDEINRLSKNTDVDALAEKLGIKDNVEASSQGFIKAYQEVNKTDPTPEQIKANKLEELIAYLAEKRSTESILDKAGRFIKELVGAFRNWLRGTGFSEVSKLSTTDLYHMIQEADKNLAKTSVGATLDKDGNVVFRFGTGGGDGTPTLSHFDYTKKSGWQNLKGNLTGLRFATQFVDRLAPLVAVSKKDADAQRAAQMVYWARMADQRMSFSAQSAGNGALQVVQKPDGGYVVESTKGPNLHNVSKLLSQSGIKDSVKAEQMFTAYLAGERANNKGWQKLNFSDPAAAKADYDAVQSYLEANPKAEAAFKSARDEYNEYNKGLVNFLVQTGAISKDLSKRLLKDNDYVPFYRSKGDKVELIISGEHPITIGSLKDQPYLHELVGGEEKILPFMTSAIQNTIMMTDMGLRNMATKNSVFTMRDMFGPEAVNIGKKGGAAGPNVLRFYDHGVEKHAVLNKEFFDAMGIPADLLVHGMEGIKTTMPLAVRMMGIPARFLRHMVTRNPMYAVRQLIRDSFSASLLTGADITPVASAIKELATMIGNRNPTEALLANRGIIGGQVLTGTAEDMETMLRDAAANKTGWASMMAKLDNMSMKSDAATRVAMYNSFIKQGMSEMEATLATLESMNFNKRGVSPSVHWINTMVPFFNAQIQGLNVMWQALSGGMTGEAKVKATRKLMVRGVMLMASTLAYAAVMQDDDDYKELTPDERWQYWFFKIPGQKEPLRIPIPFEAGLLFKALPELMVNASAKDSKDAEVWKAVRSMLLNLIPGGGSYGLPQAPKALIEVATNHDFFTGHEIENRREQMLDPAERYRDTNSELAKSLGKAANISPRMIDHLMNGYLSATGMTLVKALDPAFVSNTAVSAKAEPKPSQGLGGSLYQGTEAYGLINGVYDYMLDAEKAKATFDKMVKEGRRADAMAYLQENAKRLQAAPLAGGFKTQMQKLTELERQVRAAPNMAPAEKRKTLDIIQERRKEIAKVYRPYTE